MRTSTIGPIFKGLYLDTCPTICVGVFGVFSYLLPGEVGSQSVNFSTVVPYEKNQVFCGEVSRVPSICECTRLNDL